MTDAPGWMQSLPTDIQAVLASYDAVASVDIMAVLRREKLLRRAVSHMSWDEVVEAGVGLRNNSFGAEPGVAIDLMRRPEAGLLYVGGFFTELGVPTILQKPHLRSVDEYKQRIETTRILVDAINAGDITETTWEFIDNGWLLARARDRLSEVGPEWALNRDIVDPVIAGAAHRLDQRLRDIAFDKDMGLDAKVVDLAAHKSVRGTSNGAEPKAGVERLMHSLISRNLFKG